MMLVRLTSRIMDRGTERPVGALVEVAADCTWVARGLAVEVVAEKPVKPAPVAAPLAETEPAPAIVPAPEPEPIAVASPPPAPARRRGRHAE